MTGPAEFEELRGRTFAIAYRMTGSVADAEEIQTIRIVRNPDKLCHLKAEQNAHAPFLRHRDWFE